MDSEKRNLLTIKTISFVKVFHKRLSRIPDEVVVGISLPNTYFQSTSMCAEYI